MGTKFQMLKGSLWVALLIFSGAYMQAQVTIGSSAEPHGGAVLDLQSSGNKGLFLPRVSLDNTDDFQLEGDAETAAGMIIYNTNEELTSGKGVYVWDGEQWLLASRSGGSGGNDDGNDGGGIVIVNPPTTEAGTGLWSGKRCFNYTEFGNAAADAGVSSRTYTFRAEGAISDLSFSYLSSNLVTSISTPTIPNGNIASGETFDVVLNIKAVPTGGSHEIKIYANYSAGLNTYNVPLIITVQPTNCCGVNLNLDDGRGTRFVEFMCYNLGGNSDTSNGNYYQWGAKTNSWTNNNNNTLNSNAWTDGGKSELDPCPAGWRVPSNAVWAKIRGVPNSWNSTKGGYDFGDFLFLRAAGDRNGVNGNTNNNGLHGRYWSSTAGDGINAYYLNFSNGGTNIGSGTRSSGFSVRCVAE